MTEAWRFLAFSSADAATNMAIDEAILEEHLAGKVPPTLRLYGFQPPAITIGYSQKLSAELIAKIRSQGFDVVRRPTGGRAVLHLDDLTYSFVGSSEDATKRIGNACSDGSESTQRDNARFLQASVAGAYRQICTALIMSFKRFGLELEMGQSNAAYREQHDCFLATTSADLHIAGKKMIGSAQVRRRHAVAQHGSILLKQDQSLMPNLLSRAAVGDGRVESKIYFQDRHANLFEVLGKILTMQELEVALKSGFEEAFKNRFEVSKLSDREQILAQELRSQYLIS